MELTVEELLNSKLEFKICSFCENISLAENESCIHCLIFPKFFQLENIASRSDIILFVDKLKNRFDNLLEIKTRKIKVK